MSIIKEISENLQIGKAKNVKSLVQQALDEKMDPKTILDEGLLSGMAIIGEKFKNNEVFVPEVLVAARAMNAGLSILEPQLRITSYNVCYTKLLRPSHHWPSRLRPTRTSVPLPSSGSTRGS